MMIPFDGKSQPCADVFKLTNRLVELSLQKQYLLSFLSALFMIKAKLWTELWTELWTSAETAVFMPR